MSFDVNTEVWILVQDLDILADFPTVKDYFQKIESRDSWKNTIYSEEIVIAGWKQHIADKKAWMIPFWDL